MSANPLHIGQNYCLRLPDGRSLGHVRVARLEDGWAEGPFTPHPAFEEIRPLFAREAELARDQVIPLWEEAADAIEALGISVAAEGAEHAFRRLRFHLDGNELLIGAELPSPVRDTGTSHS